MVSDIHKTPGKKGNEFVQHVVYLDPAGRVFELRWSFGFDWERHDVTQETLDAGTLPPMRLSSKSEKEEKSKEEEEEVEEEEEIEVKSPPPKLPEVVKRHQRPLVTLFGQPRVELIAGRSRKWEISIPADLSNFSPTPGVIRLVLVSDTHNHLENVVIPNGDLLLHAGDFTVRGTESELKIFAERVSRLPHPSKVIINGNHESDPKLSRSILTRELYSKRGVVFLSNEPTVAQGIRIYGTEWKGDWKKLPGREVDVDVLITHRPPLGHGDVIYTGESRGRESLTKTVEAIQPVLHLFGHNHEGYGITSNGKTLFINAANAIGGAKSELRRPAIVLEFRRM